MSLVARACPDPQFVDADGRVRADVVVIRSAVGEEITGELVRRQRCVFPIPAELDAAVAAAGFRRSAVWRRCAGESGDEWEAEVIASYAGRTGATAHAVRAAG